MKFRKIYLVVSWALFILILISVPTSEYDGTKITLYDKAAHIVLFGVLAYLIVYALSDVKKLSNRIIYAVSFTISTSYSILAEYIQNFIPGRTVSVYDSVAGVLGVVIVLLFSYFINSYRRN